MEPGSWSKFWYNTENPFEKPTFREKEGKFIGRMWILHYNKLAKGLVDVGYELGNSLIEIIVDYPNPSIEKINLLQTVPCPRKENFKAHGGCLLM